MTLSTAETSSRAPVLATTPKLHRQLGLLHTLGVVLSGAAPAVTVFLYVPVQYSLSGTGSFVMSLLGIVLAVLVALIYAELTSAYPLAGAEYSVVGRVLGRPTGFVMFVVMMVFYFMLLATYASGFGYQLQTFWPGAPARTMGLVALTVGVLLSYFSMKMSSLVTGFFLALQLIAVLVVTILGLANAHDPAERLFGFTAWAPDGKTAPWTWSLVLLGLTVAYFNQTGFNAAAMLAEETLDAKRKLVRVYLAGVAAIFVFVVVPTGAALLGAPDAQQLALSRAPMAYLMQSLGIGAFGEAVNVIVALAMLNATVALVMVFGRVLWSGARDGALPGKVTRWVSHVHPRFRTPYVASMIMAAVAGLSMFSSTVTGLVTLTGFITIVYMGLMAVAAIRLRRMRTAPEDRYRMPLWPLAPAVVIVTFAVLATGQTVRDLYIVMGAVAVALIYYFAYLHPRRSERWQMLETGDD